MASADVNRLFDNARIRLPGALDNVLKLEFFSIMNDFFQQTSAWTEDLPITVNPTTQTKLENPDAYTYDLVPNGGSIIRLMYLQNAQGTQQFGTLPDMSTIIIDHAPSGVETWTATVGKTVTDPVTKDGYPEFPDWVLNKYNTEILDGLLGRMMAQPAKPYSSPQLAAFHTKSFKAGVQRAYVETLHGNVYRAQSWSFPQSFNRRRAVKGF